MTVNGITQIIVGILIGLLAGCNTIRPTSAPATLSNSTLVETSQAKPTSSDSATVQPNQAEPSLTKTSFPAISVGELWIVTQPNQRKHLLLVRPDGTDPVDILTQLPQEQLHPDWSPDGSQLTFEHTPQGWDSDVRDVWISDANGDHARPLVTAFPTDLEGLWWANPAWSPDGSAIAMIGYKGNASATLPSRSVIVIVELSSGEISVVADVAQTSGSLHSFPRWSPDGKAFVIADSRFEGEEFTGQAIAIIRKTDNGWSTPTVITSYDDFASRPDWHPSEDLIVFSTYDYGDFSESDEPSNLYTIRPDGTELTPVTTFGPGEDRASQASWTSDGRIIFTYVTGAADDRQSPAFINVDGSGLKVLTGLENLVHSRLRPLP